MQNPMQGDVYSFLKSHNHKLSEEVAVCLILEPFLSGMAAMHATGLIHRDIVSKDEG